MSNRCILFHFYIKPQRRHLVISTAIVVSYSISTSNHNAAKLQTTFDVLYLIPFLHQTTTILTAILGALGCILFHFYIKPQLMFLLLILVFCCILFHFYIKPQPSYINSFTSLRCILFHFYIKPQLCRLQSSAQSVVSYSISTSNHNEVGYLLKHREVVSYSISTSNHNFSSGRHTIP